MAWIKRNIFLVVTLVVAIGLLGFAGFFLWTKMQSAEEVSGLLTAQTEELKQLAERKPHPGTDKVNNINAAKQEVTRVTNFLAEIKSRHFEIIEVSNQVGAARFKALLENTIGQLERNAKQVSVSLPPTFAFSFTEQRKKVDLNAKALPILLSQLKDVENICNVLFNARINQITSIRRSPTADDPAMGGDDYLSRKLDTNTVANTLTSSYEANFVGFSADLAAVLEGLVKAKGCFIVKSVTTETFKTGEDQQDGSTSLTPAASSMAARYGMDPRMAARYGMAPGGRGADRYGRGRAGGAMPGMNPAMPIQQAQPQKLGPGTHLDENKLQIKVLVDVVKLKPGK